MADAADGRASEASAATSSPSSLFSSSSFFDANALPASFNLESMTSLKQKAKELGDRVRKDVVETTNVTFERASSVNMASMKEGAAGALKGVGDAMNIESLNTGVENMRTGVVQSFDSVRTMTNKQMSTARNLFAEEESNSTKSASTEQTDHREDTEILDLREDNAGPGSTASERAWGILGASTSSSPTILRSNSKTNLERNEEASAEVCSQSSNGNEKSSETNMNTIRSSLAASFSSFTSPIVGESRVHDDDAREADDLENGGMRSTSFLLPKTIASGASSFTSSVTDAFGSPFKKNKEDDNLDCGLTRAQRFRYFIGLLLLSAFFFFLSITFLPTIILVPQKFAFSFSTGSVLAISAKAMLKGPRQQIRYMCQRDKVNKSTNGSVLMEDGEIVGGRFHGRIACGRNECWKGSQVAIE